MAYLTLTIQKEVPDVDYEIKALEEEGWSVTVEDVEADDNDGNQEEEND